MSTAGDAIPTAKRVCLVCHKEYPPEERRCPEDGTILVALAADPYAGKTLADRYELEVPIGKGATSVVYRALHLQLRRTVAIKMLKAHLVTDEDSKKRFEQEARAVSYLTHPNVVGVFDVGVTTFGEPYIVMEYLQGESLFDVLNREKFLPWERAVPIFAQACAGLMHAHRKLVIHRDVKPSNMMIVPTDEIPEALKIVDFGLAKLRALTGEFQRLTKTGEVFGSPVYMSPEQCTGKKLDQRTDVYSLGIVMYETLAGKPPFREKTTIETIRKQIKEAPAPIVEKNPEAVIPAELEHIVQRALAKHPGDRYQNMEEIRSALEAFASKHVAAGAPPYTVAQENANIERMALGGGDQMSGTSAPVSAISPSSIIPAASITASPLAASDNTTPGADTALQPSSAPSQAVTSLEASSSSTTAPSLSSPSGDRHQLLGTPANSQSLPKFVLPVIVVVVLLLALVAFKLMVH